MTVLGYWLGDANLSRAAAPYTGIAAPAALLAWTMWHPATSRLKLWLVDGIYLWTRLGLLIAGGLAAWRLFHFELRLVPWIADAWPLTIVAAALWAVQRGLLVWLYRSHRRAGDRSLVLD